MCGINGLISKSIHRPEREAIIGRMNSTLAHRGPDNEGAWSGDDITFGHRRLSIIDLSPEGNQPFFSSDKRYVIVYNGELYNFKELKLELQRSQHGALSAPFFFRTNSDTEVILAAFIKWGKKCLDYFNGMYAFAIYDTVERTVFIARDRIGVKPLYYYYGDEGFIFSSEIRGILRSEIKKFALNKAVLGEYAMYQTVFAPNTIVKSIKVLMPGHYIELSSGKATITQYYDLNKLEEAPRPLSYKETCDKVFDLLGESVQRRMIADVPFGAFLSGGIDSSIIVGLMSKVSQGKVETFNISFDESEYSESRYAKLIAKKFNTNHHEIKLTPQQFLQDLPEAVAAMDHPGGDGPNTYIVSKATKNAGITMALSGVGGDEVFAGYDVFKRMAELEKKAWLNSIPLAFRKAAGFGIRTKRKSISGNKIAELLGQEKITFSAAYPLSRSLYTDRELGSILNEANPFDTTRQIINKIPQREHKLLSAVSLAEFNTYLQNVLLRDADQMGMAVALEIREPFLDYKLIEFVLGVKDEFKFPITPKKLLVDAVGELLPPEVVNRPKMGFTLPWQHWLKNELKDFCERNISGIEKKGILKPGSASALWMRFNRNDRTITWARIWHLIVLNNWIDENKIEY